MTLLHTKPEIAAQERMVDDGNGKVEVSPVIHISGRAGSTGPLGCSAVKERAGDSVSASLSFSFAVSGALEVFSKRCLSFPTILQGSAR